jgi:hypothetical protein
LCDRFSGVITAIGTFDNNAWSIIKGILALIVAAGFGCAAAGDLFLITKVREIVEAPFRGK